MFRLRRHQTGNGLPEFPDPAIIVDNKVIKKILDESLLQWPISPYIISAIAGSKNLSIAI
jgi:hypothetical protein